MSRRLTCEESDYDIGTGTCAAPVWTEDTGFLPPLSAADALQIAACIGVVWIVGFIVRQIRKLTST